MQYCLSCRTRTKDLDPEFVTSNNRTRRVSLCAICHKKKSVFVSSVGGGESSKVRTSTNKTGDGGGSAGRVSKQRKRSRSVPSGTTTFIYKYGAKSFKEIVSGFPMNELVEIAQRAFIKTRNTHNNIKLKGLIFDGPNNIQLLMN